MFSVVRRFVRRRDNAVEHRVGEHTPERVRRKTSARRGWGWGGDGGNRALVKHGTEGGAFQDANRGLHSQVLTGPLSKLRCYMYITHKLQDEDEKQDVDGKEGT